MDQSKHLVAISGQAVSEAVSVVLCTYNGARHLSALLNSLVGQKRLPDELLVCDDGSTDATQQLIASFAKSAPFVVRWYRREQRLGPAANFVAAAQLARGDWIAFCDQDDVWHPDKLVRALAATQKHSDTAAVFCDARLTDVDSNPLGRTLWQQIAFTPHEQATLSSGSPWQIFVRHPVVSGAGLVIHARVRDRLAPIADHWLHDAWAALIAAAIGPVVSIAEPLFDYRQHEANVIGARTRTLWDFWQTFRSLDRASYLQTESQRWAALAKRLAIIPDSRFKQGTVSAVTSKLEHLRRRLEFPSARGNRWRCVAREWRNGAYRRFTKGYGPLLADLFL
jgi:glycosyltransferase involved in cell wall biosynthesis